MEVKRATCVAPATCVALPGGVLRETVQKSIIGKNNVSLDSSDHFLDEGLAI